MELYSAMYPGPKLLKKVNACVTGISAATILHAANAHRALLQVSACHSVSAAAMSHAENAHRALLLLYVTCRKNT